MKLTAELLRELVHYDPKTGVFTRNSKPVGSSNKARGGVMTCALLGKRYSMHRLAWLYMTGEWPPSNLEIDHRDRNRANNKWENLRLATHAQNAFNRLKRADNRIGFKGVGFCAKTKTFRARIQVQGKRLNLGTFPTAEEAFRAYRRAARRYHGKFARTE